MREHVATIIIAVGYNEKNNPGFGAIDVETADIFVHHGKPESFESKMSVLGRFQEWKHKVGPKIQEVEMRGGSVNSFVHHALDLPSNVVGLDLESYYEGVMGEHIDFVALSRLVYGQLEQRLRLMRNLYVALKRIRCAMQEVLSQATVLSSFQSQVAELLAEDKRP